MHLGGLGLNKELLVRARMFKRDRELGGSGRVRCLGSLCVRAVVALESAEGRRHRQHEKEQNTTRIAYSLGFT
jgi:hypothetical protein